MAVSAPLAIFISTGCSSSDAAPSVVEIPGYSQGEPLTLEEYCAARSALQGPWCDYFSKCCTANEELLYSTGACDTDYANTDSCVSHLKKFQADSGTVYAAVYAQASLDEVHEVAPTPPSVCSGTRYSELIGIHNEHAGKRYDGFRALFQGTKEKGASCKYSASCQFGLVCTETGTDKYTCEERSVSCIDSDDCPSGRVCNNNYCSLPPDNGSLCKYRFDCNFGSVCSNGGCADDRGAGGDTCKSGEACKPGYGCTLGGTCVALKSAGTACTYDGECNGRCASGKCVGLCGGTGAY